MTFEEATAQAASFNSSLGEGVATAKYKVFAFWLPDYLKNYNVVLIPTIYEVQFHAATESQAIAFQRVSVKSLVNITDLASFVSNFNTVGANDAELAAYLGL